jgi:hypothetical protein
VATATAAGAAAIQGLLDGDETRLDRAEARIEGLNGRLGRAGVLVKQNRSCQGGQGGRNSVHEAEFMTIESSIQHKIKYFRNYF